MPKIQTGWRFLLKDKPLNILLGYVFQAECEAYFNASVAERRRHVYKAIRSIAKAAWGDIEVKRLERLYKVAVLLACLLTAGCASTGSEMRRNNEMRWNAGTQAWVIKACATPKDCALARKQLDFWQKPQVKR